ncbi:hypothetical protein ACFT79_06315 [[Kitasatospora] papulosa]|uniref:hypothetical protein n=1 Tax=[Kitasatospora] papulosa TaxID=1464011 RepID=UPI00362E0564
MIAAKQVEPDVSKRSVELRDSPEGWRAQLGAGHPKLSNDISIVSVLLLLIGVALNLLQFAEPLPKMRLAGEGERETSEMPATCLCD